VPLEPEQQKALAARTAAELVQDGQIVGLGTGTTVAYLLEALGERVRAGLRFIAVPTSRETARLATVRGIPLTSLDDHPRLDIDIDGADEVDPNLNLIKGRGGALLREKLVAAASGRFVVIADESKLVTRLGEHMPVPVEVVPFGWTVTLAALSRLGAVTKLRGEKTPFHTDNGNLIIDCRFAPQAAPNELAAQVKALPGVVEHGWFLGMASLAVIAHAGGTVTRLERGT
jgi:ribose 5-phosphate isomerase A